MAHRILVIEDDQNILDNIVDVLELEGFDVIGTQFGQQGISYANEAEPDIIICDVNLPDIDGYTLLQNIRNTSTLRTTPFIFLTAMGARSEMRRGMSLGADDYISKPFTMDELIEAIQMRLAKQEDMVAEISASLEDAKRRLARSIAHELRTPLASFRMVEDVITQRIQMVSEEESDEFVTIVQSSTNRMTHLVDQMVLITEIDLDLLNHQVIEEYRVNSPVQTIVEKSIRKARSFVSKNRDQEIHVQLEQPHLSMCCDPPSLIHALAEVISNSLHFCDENSIEISQSLREDYLHLRIIDRGIGMTQSQIAQAQIPFQQVNRHEQEQQGIGLGLPLAKKIVELHHGEFLIKSELNQGTDIQILLPQMQDC